jgi:hypothetical protein
MNRHVRRVIDRGAQADIARGRVMPDADIGLTGARLLTK